MSSGGCLRRRLHARQARAGARPRGLRTLGLRFGLDLDPELYERARRDASRCSSGIPSSTTTRRSGCLHRADHRRAWAASATRYACAVEMTRAWERARALRAVRGRAAGARGAARHGLRLGLLSNTGRDLDEFVAHHGIDVDTILTSRAHGKTKPHETIFRAMLERLGVPAGARRWSATTSRTTSRARVRRHARVLVDRDDRFPDREIASTDLCELPAALGCVRQALEYGRVAHLDDRRVAPGRRRVCHAGHVLSRAGRRAGDPSAGTRRRRAGVAPVARLHPCAPVRSRVLRPIARAHLQMPAALRAPERRRSSERGPSCSSALTPTAASYASAARSGPRARTWRSR